MATLGFDVRKLRNSQTNWRQWFKKVKRRELGGCKTAVLTVNGDIPSIPFP